MSKWKERKRTWTVKCTQSFWPRWDRLFYQRLLIVDIIGFDQRYDRRYIVHFVVIIMQSIQRKYVNMLALWNKLVAKIDVRPNIYSDVNFWIIRYLLMHISCIRWNDADCDKVKNQSHIVAAAKCSQAIHSFNKYFNLFSIYPYSFFWLCVCLHFLLSAWKRFCVPWLDVYFLRWS